jgi:hypothetical protein
MKWIRAVQDLPGWIQAIAAVIGVVIAAIGVVKLAPIIININTPVVTQVITATSPPSTSSSPAPIVDTNTPVFTVEPTQATSATVTLLPSPPVSSTVTPVIFTHELPIYDADASSFSPDRSAYALFDNSIFWTSAWFSSEGDQIGAWVRVAMPEIYTVSQLRIYMVIPPMRDIADQPKEILLTFDGGSTYNAQLSYDDGWQSINFPPVNTSTVQITIQDVYPSQWENKKRVSIREVKLFGTEYSSGIIATPTEALSQMTQLPIYDASASSYASGRPISHIFDNNTAFTSAWYSSEGDQIGAWVRVAMPKIYTVSQLRIYMVVPPLRDIAGQPREILLTFDDGSIYNAQLSYDDGWQSINFSPVNTSTVQITIQDVYPSQWEDKKRVSIREVQLFGVK